MVAQPEVGARLRARLIGVLETLADPDYQRRMWVDERWLHPGFIEDLDENIHLLYDDLDVTENPYGCIGFMLRNEREAEAVEALNRVLGPLYDSLPPNTDDATVISMPEWQGVITAAREALQIFREPDCPANLS